MVGAFVGTDRQAINREGVICVLGEDKALPPVGYGIREFEAIAGLARRVGYAKVKSGEVRVFTGLDGKLKVSPLEVAVYLRRTGESR